MSRHNDVDTHQKSTDVGGYEHEEDILPAVGCDEASEQGAEGSPCNKRRHRHVLRMILVIIVTLLSTAPLSIKS